MQYNTNLLSVQCAFIQIHNTIPYKYKILTSQEKKIINLMNEKLFMNGDNICVNIVNFYKM